MKVGYLITLRNNRWCLLPIKKLFDMDYLHKSGDLKYIELQTKVQLLYETDLGVYFLDNLTGYRIKVNDK